MWWGRGAGAGAGAGVGGVPIDLRLANGITGTCEQTDRHIRLKTLPSRNFVGGW